MSWSHFRNRLEPCGKPQCLLLSLSLHSGSILALLQTAFFSIPQLSRVVWLPVATVHIQTHGQGSCQENRNCWENLAVQGVSGMKRPVAVSQKQGVWDKHKGVHSTASNQMKCAIRTINDWIN